MASMRSGMLPHVFCVYRTEEGFCPRQMDQGVDAGVVIRMGVGHDDIFQVLGIEAQLPDVVDQAGHAAGAWSIQQDQSLPGIDQVGGAPEISHKVQIAPDLKGRAIHQIWPMHIFLCRRHIAETVKMFQRTTSFILRFGHISLSVLIIKVVDQLVNLV